MRAVLLWWAIALVVPFWLLGSLLVLPPAPALARVADDRIVAGDDDLVGKVQKAIDEGVAFLKGQQRRTDGSWEISPACERDRGGWTSLAVLALLYSGCDPVKDDAVRRGLEYLRKLTSERTYVVGLQTMVFCLAGHKGDRERIQRNLDWLLAARMADGWTYNHIGGGATRAGVADNSCSQYALLGIHEAIQAGFKVEAETLEQIRRLYVKSQAGGGWGYRPGGRGASMTMTTAGLCNLIITGLDLAKGKSNLRKDGSAEHCGEYIENEPIQKALTWIGGAFPGRLTEANATERLGHPFYCLYGIERAGRLSGQRYFGGHDWYEIGCRFLVAAQKADGSWSGAGSKQATFDHWSVVATSFSLLFLSRGKTPVLISKLAYGGNDYSGWNNKRSDVKHLVEFTSKALFKGKPLAWQAFDIRRTEASTEASRRKLAAELLQSPIVFLNGHDLAPSGKEAEVLREFAANGGFILAECCCGKDRMPDFDKDFRRLMKEIFPDSELTRLEPEHPIWLASGKYASSPRDFPLWGIKQGCKTVVVYSPTPLAGYWEHHLHGDKGPGQKAFELGANIIAYATGLEAPRPRLSQVEIATDNPREKVKRGYLQVGQLRHEGDWQPAPKAMRNLMVEARRVGLDVVLKTTPVYPSDEAVRDFRFLYMHGRAAFSQKKEDLKHLRHNLKTGGLLLADACCGARAFDTSFRAFVQELFAEDKLKLEPIPLTDPLYSAELNGEAITTVRRRFPAAGGKGVDPTPRAVRPDLEGVKYRGRWVVIYSKIDIGCALEKHASPECLGHDPASALRLARAAVLYALGR